MGIFHEEDFSLYTESDQEKLHLEQVRKAEEEAKEKREQLTYKKFNSMVGGSDIEDAKNFCNFIDELCKTYLEIPVNRTKQSTLEKLTEMKEGRLSLKEVEKTLTLVAKLDSSMTNFKKAIDLKKESESYEIKIYSGYTDKTDKIIFTLKNGTHAIFNLELTNAEKINYIYKPIYNEVQKIRDKQDKITEEEKGERRKAESKKEKLEHINNVKKLTDQGKMYEKLIYDLTALPLDFVEQLSHPLSQIASLQSNLEVDDNGEYIKYDGYQSEFNRLSEEVLSNIDNFYDNLSIDSDEAELIEESLDRIENMFEIV